MNHRLELRKIFLFIAVCVLFVLASPLWAQGQGGGKLGFWELAQRSRVWMAVVFSIVGLILLNRGWVSRQVRALFLVLILFVFGFLTLLPLGGFSSGLAPHPSPVCLVARPFEFWNAGRSLPAFFLVLFSTVALLSIVGNKLFCGWVCPVGALQELVNLIPLPKKWKIVIPFRYTNAVRILVFVAFFVFLFSSGVMIYEYFSPFEFFHFGFQWLAIASLAVVVLASLFIFRPFCYLLCPLGLVTWVLEQISIFRIRLSKKKCNDCLLCVTKTGCPAVGDILEGSEVRPDCFACGRCINRCGEDALKFNPPGIR